jgi:oxygen-independent coproporphyrinogen III oxidase
MMEKITAAYLHFPFCVRKCPYCDFVSFENCLEKRGEYTDALIKEIEQTEKSGTALQTIYMGGGTPSLFSPDQIRRILTALEERFGIRNNAEITIEANPGTVDLKSLSGYRKAGVNRISIGVQSFSDPLLCTLGRIHSGEQARKAIEAAKSAGFSNISCDLMTGLPGQSLEDAEESLRILLEYGVPHISFYALTLEEGTPYYGKYRTHDELLPDPDLERTMYNKLLIKLRSAGYRHYEISNSAKPGFESRHNLTYWKALPYYGFGCGAYSYRNNMRQGYTGDLNIYLKEISKPDPDLAAVLVDSEVIGSEERKKEFMLLGFRLMEGVSPEEFYLRFGERMENLFAVNLKRLSGRGLILFENGRYRLSDAGLDFANEVFREFV